MSKHNENRPGYKNTYLGWIPEGWPLKALGSIGEFLKGKGIMNDDKVDSGVPCITYGEIYTTYDFVVKQFKSFIKREIAEQSQSIRLNDLLFAGSGETPDEIGKCVAYVESSIAYAGGDVIIFRQNKESSLYLAYLINSDIIKRHRRKLGQGHSVVHIYSSSLKTLRIPIPPVSEQKKIAEILFTWDSAIEQTRKLIDAKKRLKKGLMQQLLTGRLRFPQFGHPAKNGELPEEWKRVKSNTIFRNKSKKNNADAPVLSVTQDKGVVERDLMNRKINMSYSNTSSYKLVEPGDFVISLRSFQGGLEYSNLYGVVSPAYHVLATNIKICHSYFKHYFKSYEFIGRLSVAVIGIRDGKQISFEDFAYMKLPVPSIKEQEIIAELLDRCSEEIKLLNKKQSTLETQKHGLMQKLLTGEIRVNHLTK